MENVSIVQVWPVYLWVSFPAFCSYDMLMSVCVFACVVYRERQVMWLRAVTMPETGPGLRSSHTSTKTNSRALRHMHVSRSSRPFFPHHPSLLLDPPTFFNKLTSFLCRFHQLAGQLWGVHGHIRDGHVRGASREQGLHWCPDADQRHEGAVAVREGLFSLTHISSTNNTLILLSSCLHSWFPPEMLTDFLPCVYWRV